MSQACHPGDDSSGFACERCAAAIPERQASTGQGLCEPCQLSELYTKRLRPAQRWLWGTLLASIVANGFKVQALNLALRESPTESTLAIVRGASYCASIATFSTMSAWCIWHARTSRFLSSAGKRLTFGPSAAAWFFVPLAGLYKPYQATRELWRVSTGERGDSPVSFRVWWFCWVFAALFFPAYLADFLLTNTVPGGSIPQATTAASWFALAGASALRVTSHINGATKALVTP